MIIFLSAFLNLIKLIFSALFFIILSPFLKTKSVYYFINFAGPSFIKLGQTLSTRPDLVGKKLAQILTNFQDRVKPFNEKIVKQILQKNFDDKFNEIFSEFDYKAKASASIAQVHKAVLKNNKIVAVKILRPNIEKITKKDIATLNLIIFIVKIFSKNFAKTLTEINSVLKNSAKTELNLIREASMAIRLKQEMKDVKGFYVPKIYTEFCHKEILVLEWLDGIAFSDEEKIMATNFDKKELAKNFLIAYFTQVYQNGFFHADMHPGNLFLLENGDIAVVDFGIMAEIDKKLRIAIAEILIAYLNEDYKKVAQIHIEAEIVPKDVDLFELTLSCQKIGEKMVGNSVKDIPISEILKQLIEMTKNYQISTKPELLLLQKTILLVEGSGMMLDHDFNIWIIAKPWVKEWAKKNISFDAKIRDLVVDFFEGVKKAIKM